MADVFSRLELTANHPEHVALCVGLIGHDIIEVAGPARERDQRIESGTRIG